MVNTIAEVPLGTGERQIMRKGSFWPVVFCAVLFVASGFAVSKTWNGGTGNWSNGADWTPSGIPGVSDTVTIDSTGANDNVTLDTTGSVNTLTLGHASGTHTSLLTDAGVAENRSTPGTLTVNKPGTLTFTGGGTF